MGLGFNLEGADGAEIVTQICKGSLEDLVLILFAGTATAEADYTEDVVTSIPCPVQVTVFIFRLYIDSRLDDAHAEFAEGAHATGDIGLETVLKLEAVAALQDDLA